MKVSIDQWQVDVDVEATRAVYQRTSRGSPADCSCIYCRNFAALGDNAFPQSFRDLAGELGIDYRKAAEVVDLSDSHGEQLEYAGWFHFIGTIEAGADETCAAELSKWPSHRLTDDFEILVREGRNVAFPEFADYPLVELHFLAKEPWLLPEPCPTTT